MRERLGGGPTGRWRQACSRAPGWCWTPAPGKQMATGRGLRGTRGLQGQRFSLSWGPGSQPLIPDFHNHASFLTRGPFKLISIQEGMKAVNGNLARCLASRVGVEFSRRVPAGFGGGLLPVRTHAPLASPQVPAGRDLCLGDINWGDARLLKECLPGGRLDSFSSKRGNGGCGVAQAAEIGGS